jgi:hypothetical protein
MVEPGSTDDIVNVDVVIIYGPPFDRRVLLGFGDLGFNGGCLSVFGRMSGVDGCSHIDLIPCDFVRFA